MSTSTTPASRLRNKTADFLRKSKRDDESAEPRVPMPTPASLDLVHTVSRSSAQVPTPSPATSTKTRLSLSFLTRTRKRSQTTGPPETRPSLGINTNVDIDANQPILDISPVDVVTPTVVSPSESTSELCKPLGSASFLSRFSPLKTRRSPRESEDVASLQAPQPASNAAFDSVSSSNSSSYVPVTPKVTTQPTITVSHPDSSLVEEYRDIFTYAPLGRSASIHHGAEPQVDEKHAQRQRTLSSKSADPRPVPRSRSTAQRNNEVEVKRSKGRDKRESESVSLNARRSSIRSLSSIPSPPETPPPPLPLPSPPSSAQTFSTPAAAYAARAMRSSPSLPAGPRRRATTLSTSGSASPPPPMTLRKVASTPLDRLLNQRSFTKESIEVAQPEQLRGMVQAESSRFEELAGYLLTLVEIHNAEKTSLERRIALLESEAKKKEKEMKGLRWLMMNETAPASPTSSGTTLDPGAASITSGGRRTRRKPVGNTFESDSESMSRTSGFETSDSNSIFLKHRRKQLDNHHRTGSTGLGLELPNGNGPYLGSTTKRSSIASYASSPSSSTSSLGLHLPANLHSHGLTAIPEASTPPTPLPQQETTPMPTQQKDLPLASAPSPSGASSDNEERAASVAYAANLKRHKHASIDQVLSQSSEGELNSALQKM
ncbi:hypothetical protein BDV98DRAFT_563245, partial [Pterulicium gracile]